MSNNLEKANKQLSSTIFILEDDQDSLENLKECLKTENVTLEFAESYKEGESYEELAEYLEDNEPPDLIITDICLVSGESDKVTKTNKSISDFVKLFDISGIKILSWVKQRYPKIPVIAMSGFWDTSLPSLSQHALCLLDKNKSEDQDTLKKIVEIAQKIIIGVKIHPDLKKKFEQQFKECIEEINGEQNAFIFVLCESAKELAIPIGIQEGITEYSNPLLTQYVEVWNNRISGVMSDISGRKDRQSDDEPLLPFSNLKIPIFENELKAIIDYMGKRYFKAYLLREILRAAYGSFYNIHPHPVTGDEFCIFNFTIYKKGFPAKKAKEKERRYLCKSCKQKISEEDKAEGGCSAGIKNSLEKITQVTKEAAEESGLI